jgi:hypothetical protein
MKIKNKINRMIEKFHRYLRQRNYKLIYSDRYGYGVEHRVSYTLIYHWFSNHTDVINYEK